MLTDNDEKENQIKELISDLSRKTSECEVLMTGLQNATQDQDKIEKLAKEKEVKMTALQVEKNMTDKRLQAIKIEKDMKEREAADHLIEVESKAARVDELEKKLVLLGMDKDKLKAENG